MLDATGLRLSAGAFTLTGMPVATRAICGAATLVGTGWANLPDTGVRVGRLGATGVVSGCAVCSSDAWSFANCSGDDSVVDSGATAAGGIEGDLAGCSCRATATSGSGVDWVSESPTVAATPFAAPAALAGDAAAGGTFNRA
ncbi:MAG TPA: hypothetical protein VK708_09740 [Bryobacteraceae bacterium]|nr:hypothetical protein [Bryobacteraceae bacterium]